MRAKRSKKYRKIMITYEQTFGFRPPFQVLLSSAFIRTCNAFKMPLQKSLENTLHNPSRLFITKCTLAKILADEKERRKRVGENEHHHGGRPEWLPPPTELPLRYCKHNDEEGAVQEWRCLVDLVAGQARGNEQARNKSHFVLAVAEAGEEEQSRKGFVEVRERARMVPGVPLVYVKRSVMVLEELSAASEGVRRGVERGKFKAGIIGAGGDRKRKRGEGEGEDGNANTDGNLDGGRAAIMKKVKAKGPKQPNPLSVPKKKVLPQVQAEEIPVVADTSAEEVDDPEDAEQVATASVKKGRKRRHGKKKAMDGFRKALLESDGDESANAFASKAAITGGRDMTRSPQEK
jgi:U3 small nucleolar RNA-associated protein 23